MSPFDAIRWLREANVPKEVVEPLSVLVDALPTPPDERTLGQVLADAHAAWFEKERAEGREPGDAFPIPPGLDDV